MPNSTLVMLGYQDSKNWNQKNFVADYVDFIKNLRAVKTEVYIIIPPPCYLDGYNSMNATVINTMLPDAIQEVATQANVDDEHVIDLFDQMGGESLSMGYMFDPTGLPYPDGNYYIASIIYNQLGLNAVEPVEEESFLY
jgi:hypothetical protein